MLSPILPVNPLNLIQVVPISHSAMGTISIDLIGRPNIDFVRPKRAVNAKEWAGFRWFCMILACQGLARSHNEVVMVWSIQAPNLLMGLLRGGIGQTLPTLYYLIVKIYCIPRVPAPSQISGICKGKTLNNKSLKWFVAWGTVFFCIFPNEQSDAPSSILVGEKVFALKTLLSVYPWGKCLNPSAYKLLCRQGWQCMNLCASEGLNFKALVTSWATTHPPSIDSF